MRTIDDLFKDIPKQTSKFCKESSEWITKVRKETIVEELFMKSPEYLLENYKDLLPELWKDYCNRFNSSYINNITNKEFLKVIFPSITMKQLMSCNHIFILPSTVIYHGLTYGKVLFENPYRFLKWDDKDIIKICREIIKGNYVEL